MRREESYPPAYDIVCAAAWPDLSTDMAMRIGSTWTPESVSEHDWSLLAGQLGLSERAFARRRRQLVDRVVRAAEATVVDARCDGWHHASLDAMLEVARRRARVVR